MNFFKKFKANLNLKNPKKRKTDKSEAIGVQCLKYKIISEFAEEQVFIKNPRHFPEQHFTPTQHRKEQSRSLSENDIYWQRLAKEKQQKESRNDGEAKNIIWPSESEIRSQNESTETIPVEETKIRELNDTGKTQNANGKTQNDTREIQNDTGKTQNDSGKTQNDTSKSQNDTGKTQNNTGKTQNDTGKTQNNIGKTQNNTNKTQNDTNKTQNDTGKTQNNTGKTQNESNIDAKQPITKSILKKSHGEPKKDHVESGKGKVNFGFVIGEEESSYEGFEKIDDHLEDNYVYFTDQVQEDEKELYVVHKANHEGNNSTSQNKIEPPIGRVESVPNIEPVKFPIYNTISHPKLNPTTTNANDSKNDRLNSFGNTRKLQNTVGYSDQATSIFFDSDDEEFDDDKLESRKKSFEDYGSEMSA